MVEVVRLGVLDAQTALSRYAKHRPPQSVARLRDALKKANLLNTSQPKSKGHGIRLPSGDVVYYNK